MTKTERGGPEKVVDNRPYIDLLKTAAKAMEPVAMEPEGCEHSPEGPNIAAMSEFLELFRGSGPSKRQHIPVLQPISEKPLIIPALSRFDVVLQRGDFSVGLLFLKLKETLNIEPDGI
jgi:hypothetical protein